MGKDKINERILRSEFNRFIKNLKRTGVIVAPCHIVEKYGWEYLQKLSKRNRTLNNIILDGEKIILIRTLSGVNWQLWERSQKYRRLIYNYQKDKLISWIGN